MKTTFALCSALVAGVVLVPAASRAGDTVTNRLSLSARFGFNISGKFKGGGSGFLPAAPAAPGTPAAPAAPRLTPDGDAYNYDDGYVLTDVSGNYGGLTWYWGYDDSARQVAGDTILLSRSTYTEVASSSLASSSSDSDSDPNYGAELAYSRRLGVTGKMAYGFEVAANYLNVSFSDSSTFLLSRSFNQFRVTDAYPYTPGTTPPLATPADPYQGRYEDSTFLIGDRSVSSSATLDSSVATDRRTNQRQFDSDVWGFRLGPYLEIPLWSRINLSVSGGLAVGLLDSTVSWTQTTSLAGGASASTRSGANDLDTAWGYYVRADVSWQFSHRWSAVGGVQFQDLGTCQQSFAGQQVELNLRNSLFLTAGLGYSF